MKMKMLLAALLLMGGATSTFAQDNDPQKACRVNSSLATEAVKAGNFKDAYAPCMAVMNDCPTLLHRTYTDAQKILTAFLREIKDRQSADYKKYFDELMNVYDLRMKYIPEFVARGMKGVPSVADALGAKAVDYMQYAPAPDLNTAYNWLSESVRTEKEGSKSAVLHHFLDVSMQKLKADDNHTGQFFQDYIDASKYADDAIAAETNEKKKEALQNVKDNLLAMFIQSGVADCESLQNIYGPKVEENKADSAFLKKALLILNMMKCKESEVYFKASEYMYRIDPTADAAVGVASMYYKKGDYDNAVKYFNEALEKETDNAKRSEMACGTAAALMSAKKWAQAKPYCIKAMNYNENFGQPYILLAQIYAANPKWDEDPAKNKCTFFLVIDKLRRAKAIDSTCEEQANELIATYSRYLPKREDLFMQNIKEGDRITIGGLMGETTTVWF